MKYLWYALGAIAIWIAWQRFNRLPANAVFGRVGNTGLVGVWTGDGITVTPPAPIGYNPGAIGPGAAAGSK